MVTFSLAKLVLFPVLLWIFGAQAATHQAYRPFEDVYRDAKMKPWDSTHRIISQPSGREADPSQFRFYSNATSGFRVNSLPDVPFTVGELYSGLMPVKAGDVSRQLFFVYQPTIGPPVDTITVWLNGGPGCSSMEGFFRENGRFVWPENAPAPALNDHSWVNVTNMLWVEQPIGTGYTVGKPTATSEEDIANDFVGFFKNFQETFGIKNFKIYVAGESYAGRYVPYISSAFLDQKDTSLFDLKGAMIYDPCIGAYETIQQQVAVVPFAKANKDLLRLNEGDISDLEEQHKSCGYQGMLDKYLRFPPPGLQAPFNRIKSLSCDLLSGIQFTATTRNRCFDIYMINKTCPKTSDVMKSTWFKPAYFDRADVKAALHAPPTSKWALCSKARTFVGRGGPHSNGDLSPDPIQAVLPKVIQATNRVLVSNGDYDMIITTNGTLLAIQNMTWSGSLGFQNAPATPVEIPGRTSPAGIQHYERGLMWTQAFKTGHMGPEYAPEVALRQLEWLLGKRESL